MYNKFKEWINDNNRFPSQVSDDLTENKLGKWASDKRKAKKLGRLSNEQINLLNDVKHWYWNRDDLFNETYIELKNWIQHNNRLPLVTNKDKIEHDFARWIEMQRNNKKKSKINDNRVKKLEEIIYWEW